MKKEATLLDLYEFDNFMASPGIKDSLMELYRSGSDEFSIEDGIVYYDAPHGESIAVGKEEPIVVAGGGAYIPPELAKQYDIKEIGKPISGLVEMGAATAKGITQGFVGTPGDIEAIAKGIYEIGKSGADQGVFKSFIKGYQQGTILPKTEEVKKWLDENIGKVGTGDHPMESIGEIAAPGGQVAVTKKAVKKVAKTIKSKVQQ